MTDIESLKQFKLVPSAGNFRHFIDKYGSFVYSSALREMGQSQDAIEVTEAVFQALVRRAHQLPRKTFIAGWLFRAIRLAIKSLRRSRKRTREMVGSMSAVTPVSALVDNAIEKLPSKYRDPILVRDLLRLSGAESARELGISEEKAQIRRNKGLKKVANRLKKQNILVQGLEDLFRSSPVKPVEGLVEAIATVVEKALTERRNPKLVQGIFWGLAWSRWRRRFRIAVRVVGMLLAFLLATGLLIGHLFQTGQLTPLIVEWSARHLAKEVPEAAQPAKPWNDLLSRSLSASNLVTSADLYRMTNVWRANLKFSREQWQQLEPKHIPPLANMQQEDGGILLRNPNARRNGLSGVLGYEFDWVKAYLEFGGVGLPGVAARFKGNGTYIGSLYGQKRSFKVDLNKFTKGQEVAGVHILNFLNMIEDSSCLHDALGYEVFREIGVPAPRTAYAWLTVDVEGKWVRQPLGLYLLVENLDGDFAAEHFGTKKAPIFKPVTYELFKDLGDDWSAYAGMYDLKTKATDQQKRRVIEFARLLTRAKDAEFARRVGEYLDLDEFARFVAGMVLESSYDGFLSNGQNFYMYLDPRSNKFGFIPWDLDHSWGEFGYIGKAETRETASIWKPWAHPNRLLERVIVLDEFKKLYRAQLETMLATTFSPERLFRRIDEMVPVVRSPTEAESTFRLKRLDQATSTNWIAASRDGEPTGPKRPVHQLKRYITNRVKSVREQLDGKSEGSILSLRDHH